MTIYLSIIFFNINYNIIIVLVRFIIETNKCCPNWIWRVSFSAFVLRWRPWCFGTGMIYYPYNFFYRN